MKSIPPVHNYSKKTQDRIYINSNPVYNMWLILMVKTLRYGFVWKCNFPWSDVIKNRQ